MKRIFLLVATNLAILVLLGIVLGVLQATGVLGGLLDEQGQDLNYGTLFVFCAVFGFGGSFISLWISKWMAKRMTGAQVIEQASNDTEAWLLQTVSHQAQAAGIAMPEVAIFPSEDPNAFATGARKDAALVAVSVGLLRNMSPDEVEAVLAHEISHVANGDMVTLTLIQGVLNTFVFFFSRVIGHFVDRVILKNDRGFGIGYWVTTFVAQMVLALLASMIVMWFSRQREFRAAAGGGRLAGREKMASALERLKTVSDPQPLPEQMSAFGISGGGGLMRLFATHPPLEERIERLRHAG